MYDDDDELLPLYGPPHFFLPPEELEGTKAFLGAGAGRFIPMACMDRICVTSPERKRRILSRKLPYPAEPCLPV